MTAPPPPIAIASRAWSLNPAAPLWFLIGAGLVAAAVVIYLYPAHKKVASPRLVFLLTVIRASLIFLVVSVLLAPIRVSTYESHSRGTLWLLVDQSASMRQIDRQAPADELQRWAEALGHLPVEQVKSLSRGELATAAFTSRAGTGLPTLGDIVEQYDVKIIPVGDPHIVVPDKSHVAATIAEMLHNPSGKSTGIGDALRLVSADPKDDATALVISDGRQNAGTDPIEQARRLAQRGTRVFTLAIGSSQSVRDAAVDFVDAPDWVFRGDDVVLSASIRLDGINPGEHVTIELRRDGRLIDQKAIAPTAPRVRVEFTNKPDLDGVYQYEIAIRPIPGEAVTDNNRQAARVAVKHEKLKVLLLEDEPRWEYQFLRNYLSRDHRFDLQSVLLEPARIENIRRPAGVTVPSTREGWSKFDIVLLGDVSPERLPREQQENLVIALREGQIKGLALIAGPRNMPDRFAGAPLAEVLPVELTGSNWTSQHLQDQLRRGFVAVPVADSLLTRFSPDYDINEELCFNTPQWFWHSERTTARPGATVAWAIADPSAFRAGAELAPIRHRALVATMRYGAGRVLYLASPETWRLRYVQRRDGQVEALHRRFWGQAFRWASAGPARDDDAGIANVEDRNVNADPQRMAAIAKAGGGLCLDGPDFGRLASQLPRTDHVGTAVFRVGLFDDPRNWRTRFVHWSVFVVFVGLIATEWMLRKRGGLV